jgi:hypothetical protein
MYGTHSVLLVGPLLDSEIVNRNLPQVSAARSAAALTINAT